jgi:hypothetical protein
MHAMSPRDPAAGEFARLLDDIAELQEGRRFAKAMAASPQPKRRDFVPHSYLGKAQRVADTANAAARAATAAELTRAITGIERLAAENRKMALTQAGEKRARLRQQATDLLRRAMIGLGRGEITATEIAGLEGRVNRFLAELDHQQGPVQVRARVAA